MRFRAAQNRCAV